MMSTNRSGDCCSHTLVNAICTNIKSLALSEHDTLLDLIQKILTEMLHKSVNIHLIIQDNRHFPQLFIEEDSMLCIRCFCDRTFDRNNISQQPVFTAYRKWTDRILTEIIRKTASAIFQIGHKIGAAVLDIGDCPVHTESPGRFLHVKPRQKALNDRHFFFKACFFERIEGCTFYFDRFFQTEETVDIQDTLYSRLAVIQVFPFRDCIHQVPAYMCLIQVLE